MRALCFACLVTVACVPYPYSNPVPADANCGLDTSAVAFRVSVESVAVDDRAPGGAAWDGDGSLADASVCVGTDASPDAWGCTTEPRNLSAFDVNEVFEGSLADGDLLLFRVLDVDIEAGDLDGDHIGQLPLSIDALRGLSSCGGVDLGSFEGVRSLWVRVEAR